jgi:hypothetical protein
MNEHDELGTQLTRTLTEHADVMSGSSLGLADVKGRARSIRRRRSATAVAGVAAAVAVIVPTVSLATHTSGKPEPAPVTQTPSPTQTATADNGHQPKPGVLDVSDLPTGDAPALDYVEGRTFHLDDGSTGEVRSRYTPHAFVEMEDGSRVWLTMHQGSTYIELQNSDGGFDAPVPSGSYDLAVNPAHSIAAWISPAGQVWVYEGRASEPRTWGAPVNGTEWRLGAVSGTTCSLACTVYVNASDAQGHRQVWEVTDAGTRQSRDGGYLVLNDESEAGLSIGLTEIKDFSTCSKLLGGGEFQGFKTCGNQLQSFSPDGQLILALPGYFDGAGPGGIAMYSLDDTKLFERSSTEHVQSYFNDLNTAWEDDTHVLAPTFQDGKWALVRIASDGSMEYAVPPASGPYEDNPFILPTGGGLPSGD